MILEMDVGNSRIKWRLLESLGSGVMSKGIALNLEELKVRFVNQRVITKVRIASVSDTEFITQLSSWLQQRWDIVPEIAQVVRNCQGLKVAYQDLTKLGVDRWLVMLAAYKDSESACMVVDCGTALTIDMVDNTGQHLGGFIVPGVRLSIKALTASTGIKLSQADPEFGLSLGNSTDEAVYNGALTMLVAFIEKIVTKESETRSGDGKYRVYFTGGDADLICQFLALTTIDIKVIPGLVFDGLTIALSND